jgi:hypothetical protein
VDNGGDVSFESTQHLASLTLTDGTATLTEGTDKVLVLGALSINLDSAWLDLQNNGLIVNYSGTSPLATITGYVASAYTTVGATHWQGIGLTSSWAAYDPAGATGLGIIENHQGGREMPRQKRATTRRRNYSAAGEDGLVERGLIVAAPTGRRNYSETACDTGSGCVKYGL